MADKPVVLIISKEGSNAGAGKALYRIHMSLTKSGLYESRFLAWEGVPDPAHNYFVNRNTLLNKVYRKIVNVLNGFIKRWVGPLPGYVFSHNLFPNFSLQSNRLIKEADIIFLGWLGHGYLSIGQLRLFRNKVVLWRFSDMWPITGGCHVPFGCEKFKSGCQACPQLKSTAVLDLAAMLWKKRKRTYARTNIKFIAPSTWVKEAAQSSPLVSDKKIYYVPTGVDLSIFKPDRTAEYRSQLGLPPKAVVLLFGSVDTGEKRKGFHFLVDALRKIENRNENIHLLVFGTADANRALADVNLPVRYLSRVEGDEQLARVYNAANVFLAPYIDDNLPNTVIESIACGLPVVGFNSGGMCDLVDHKVNGYLADVNNSNDLATGINWIIANLNVLPLAERSRSKAAFFSSDHQTSMLIDIFRKETANS